MPTRQEAQEGRVGRRVARSTIAGYLMDQALRRLVRQPREDRANDLICGLPQGLCGSLRANTDWQRDFGGKM